MQTKYRYCYIWFTDRENLFHSYFERKYDQILTFNIAHFPDFETPYGEGLWI